MTGISWSVVCKAYYARSLCTATCRVQQSLLVIEPQLRVNLFECRSIGRPDKSECAISRSGANIMRLALWFDLPSTGDIEKTVVDAFVFLKRDRAAFPSLWCLNELTPNCELANLPNSIQQSHILRPMGPGFPCLFIYRDDAVRDEPLMYLSFPGRRCRADYVSSGIAVSYTFCV